MATKERTKSVSYRRKRNYTSNFTWTCELSRDVLEYYNKARKHPSSGYMQRMKDCWNELHHEHSHFNKQQLGQQATYVVFKGSVLETYLHQPNVTEQQEENTAEVEFELERYVLVHHARDV